MRIALLEPLGVPDGMIEELSLPIRERGHEFTHFDTATTDPAELAARSEGVDVVMIASTPYPAEVVESADELKLIAVAFTGVDHVGLAACRERGVVVCNCAGYSDVSVAELTLGLTIDVLRKVAQAGAATRSGGTSAGLMGQEICGRTVGIVGTGRIGTRVGGLFKALGARVLGYARHESPAATAAGIEFVPSLDDLLSESDVVSLHLPLNDMTRKSFGARQFARMREGSVFVNCARGAIVDNEALADALTSGQLAGAGVDVFDMEPPLPAGYALLRAPNVVLTPHVGFLTEEAMRRRARTEFDNVVAWLDGSPKNVCAL